MRIEVPMSVVSKFIDPINSLGNTFSSDLIPYKTKRTKLFKQIKAFNKKNELLSINIINNRSMMIITVDDWPLIKLAEIISKKGDTIGFFISLCIDKIADLVDKELKITDSKYKYVTELNYMTSRIRAVFKK